ncbi:hypothetical protein fugu_014121 [Takifugu bimaculatus]|uniref:Growth arrest and DNA damage-inducible protein GADD45 alpha n=1 Tax=Takifugu bimaculatus TaxID=433685 RepID=A0A4Z2C0A7_9TELE|nr:hypothetical protein fugu_014121 [Takifugu bimaculatus]
MGIILKKEWIQWRKLWKKSSPPPYLRAASQSEFMRLQNRSTWTLTNVVLCILATDDEDVQDVALQIHFTLIQAFCCENDINILRVNNTRRLAEILGGGSGKQSGGEPMDLHCVLVTSPHSTLWKDPALSKVNRFCRESRCMDQWVPIINLPER